MPHVNSGGTDDFYSSDEVKVYQHEGEEENEKRSSENLSEDKLGLVTETEEDRHKQDRRPDEVKPGSPSERDGPFGGYVPNYPPYHNGSTPTTIMNSCCICQKNTSGDPTAVRLNQKGCDSIISTSIKNGHEVHAKAGDFVHAKCRKDFTRRVKTVDAKDDTLSDNAPRVLRSVNFQFDFKSKCLFCGSEAKCSSRKRSLDVFPVRSLSFQTSVLEVCNKRRDKWADEVQTRLTHVIDLPAADAIYHQSCSVNFRTGKGLPKPFTSEASDNKSMKSPGRPENDKQVEAFQMIIKTIESGESFSINDLQTKMFNLCNENCYSSKHLKRKILEHFGDAVVVSSIDGKSDIITLKQNVSTIIHSFYNDTKDLSNEEKKTSIIETAAKLIMCDINDIIDTKDSYPSFSDVASLQTNIEYLPKSLKTFLDKLFGRNNKTKTAAIGQCAIQACRPKGLIVPLQLGLGIQLHHHFGSRFLIDTLNTMGFCSSYWEVQKYEANAAAVLSTRIPSQENDNTPFLQFVGDNVDHNIRTIDGHNTFHGMGIIAASTPGTYLSEIIPRKDVSLQEVEALGKIDIKFFLYDEKAYEGEKPCFLTLPETLQDHRVEPLDTLCKTIWPLRQNRPCWSGFMQMLETPTKPFDSKASISFMPMIDISPSDLTCINSTLHFVCRQAERYRKSPVLTFDQPIFQKATDIVSCETHSSPLRKVVLRLGGFHTEMSFLGTIGHLMSGSGLQDVFESVYATNAVPHILSGKAIQRALRGHMLIENVLTLLLFEKAKQREQSATSSDCDLPTEYENKTVLPEELVTDPELLKLASIYDDLTDEDKVSVDILSDKAVFESVENKILTERQALAEHRTARLWIQYMDMIILLQQFIRAERTGNWILHLDALRKMLPYLAASGHNLYLKSAYIYLQNMLQLPETHPDVHEAFVAGNHVVRRSDRYWAGLSTDLLIEQVLMRSLKSNGGLTRGRGFTDTQRSQWLLSMPVRLQMNNAMQEFTETLYQGSEQHKEVGKSRTARDKRDMTALFEHLRERNPFDDTDKHLRNIETGVRADCAVNVDMAETVGETIIKDMSGVTIKDFTFKRSKQVTTLSDKAGNKDSAEQLPHVDTQLLFQRLTTAADRNVEDISTIFNYELCSIPSAIFDNSGLPREAQKASLADEIWKQGDCSYVSTTNEDNYSYVIDGGSFLQKLPWTKGITYGEICNGYLEYLHRNYKGNITIIFDGYQTGPTTKDVAHLRQTQGRVGPPVKFSIETPCRMKKEQFLSNVQNKQHFLFMLSECLMAEGVAVRHADSDADLLIVKTVIERSETTPVTLLAEDTDILVLLCHYYREELHDIAFRSSSRKMSNKKFRTWDIRKTSMLIGKETCKYLPLLHSLTGCDTTSRLYGISKPAALKLFLKNQAFRKCCSYFLETKELDKVQQIGEQLLLHLYGEPETSNLNNLRYKKFASKVATSSTYVQVQTLPPTSVAAKFHSQRVFFQTRVWLGDATLNPLDYGWTITTGMMVPVRTTLPPAPEKLLKIIHCNCKMGCDSKKCSCRKHGLQCSSCCGECRGVSCSNSATLEEMDDLFLVEDSLQDL